MISESLLGKLDKLTDDDIHRVFISVNPANIPHEFILLVNFVSITGQSYTFTADEYREFFEKYPRASGAIEVAIDIQKFTQDVKEKTLEIFN